jgi:hypothetical protein
MIADKVRELLQVAKLCNDGTLGRDIRNHREQLERRRQSAINADKKYGQTIKANESKRRNLEQSWNEVYGQVRTRWKRILKGLSTALSRYEYFADLHQRDQDVLIYLSRALPDLVVIDKERVRTFDAEQLEHVDLHYVHHITVALLDGSDVKKYLV